MTIVATLEEQMKQSAEFTRHNFGLQLGSDYPEIVREVLKSEKVCAEIAKNWFVGALQSGEILKGFRGGPAGMMSDISGEPRVYSEAMNFLYWGIQVGRALERESAEALRKMEAK
jgi:hypothetical protein